MHSPLLCVVENLHDGRLPFVLGHAERSLATRRYGGISTRIEKQCYQLNLPLVGGQVQGRIAWGVPCIQVSTLFDEKRCDLGAAIGSRVVQRRPTHRAPLARRRAMSEKILCLG